MNALIGILVPKGVHPKMDKPIMKLIICIPFVILLHGCSRKPSKNDLKEIVYKLWTHTSGYKVDQADFIEFGVDAYQLRNDSIYDQNIFKGRIVKFNSKYREIEIESPEKITGNYYNHDFN